MKIKQFTFNYSTIVLLSLLTVFNVQAADSVGIWMKFEENFESSKEYENPLYDVEQVCRPFYFPLGEYEELTKKGIAKTGTENYGGPVVTAGGPYLYWRHQRQLFPCI